MDQSNTYRQTHHISDLTKLPSSAHYAVLVQNSFSYEDPYEDTKFGTITEKKLDYIAFDTEAALNAWVIEHTKGYMSKPYRVIYVKPVEVELHTTVKIKD